MFGGDLSDKSPLDHNEMISTYISEPGLLELVIKSELPNDPQEVCNLTFPSCILKSRTCTQVASCKLHSSGVFFCRV
jgi:hypothetical protein